MINSHDVELVRKLVRPYIGIIIPSVFCGLAIVGKVSSESFINVAIAVIAFYFGERSALKKPGSEQ